MEHYGHHLQRRGVDHEPDPLTGGPTNFGRFVEHYDVALNKLIDTQLARRS